MTEAENLEEFLNEHSDRLGELRVAIDRVLKQSLWDSTSDPVSLDLSFSEQANLFELVRTDNKVLNQTIIVFSSLSLEARELCSALSTRFFPIFTLFGEQFETEADSKFGASQLLIGQHFETFQELSHIVDRLYTVFRSFVSQMASLYHPKQQLYTTSFSEVCLNLVIEEMGNILSCFYVIDQLIINNLHFKECWGQYLRLVKSARSDVAAYGLDQDQLVMFEKLLLNMETSMFDGNLMRGCINQEFDEPGRVQVLRNKVCMSMFRDTMDKCLDNYGGRLDSSTEAGIRQKFVALAHMYGFFMHVWGESFQLQDDSSQRKLFMHFWELSFKCPFVNIWGNVSVFISRLLATSAPQMLQKLPPKMTLEESEMAIATFEKNMDASFPASVASLYMQTTTWMARMYSTVDKQWEAPEALDYRQWLVVQGMSLAANIRDIVRTLLFLKMHLSSSMKAHCIPSIARCLELLKAIQSTFAAQSFGLGEVLGPMQSALCHRLQAYILPIKQRLESSKRLPAGKLDLLGAVNLCLMMLDGPITGMRLVIYELSFSIVNQKDVFSSEDMVEITKIHRKMNILANFSGIVQDICDCQFFFWGRDLVPLFFNYMYENPQHISSLHYLLLSLKDVGVFLLNGQLIQNKLAAPTEGNAPAPVTHCEYFEQFKTEVRSALQEHIINPLSLEVETDLRLHVHSVLNTDYDVQGRRNPVDKNLKELTRFFNLGTLRFFDHFIDLSLHVAHYLNLQFYNLNTVALHDWKTYGEMRNLAYNKYGLELVDTHLPGATLEQGLDVLEIMRNIHVFVARYHYNLNNQIFVEHVTMDSKVINTLHIRHVSNSIRTHGSGIMNTTVNFTYQYLKKKFVIFSQFLFDDHIKSKLMRDARWYKENAVSLHNMYPVDRAFTFNKDIRKLGVDANGLSYLDHFRVLVTEIGNAMGFVRMVRSGGMHYVSNAIKFIPDLNAENNLFATLTNTTQDSFSFETLEASKNLDFVIDTLKKNFAEGVDFFDLLTQVFAPEMQSARNTHLRWFYAIVPPMTLNFVEQIMTAKDMMGKKNGRNIYFTDDGFAIGVAYILRLLGQNAVFDGLHWFDSVRQKYSKEMQEIQTKLNNLPKKSKKAAEEEQTLTLSMNKCKLYSAEFDTLFYSFASACIFFDSKRSG